jgi:cytochrome c biogenesis protein CcdA
MLNVLSIIAIGFFLGMRHATDPDHVIAVTTIVSHQRKTSRAAWIGALWGLGHTVTILAVGAAIIFLNLVVSVRLGLTMELSVGFMLILLGLWNLGGFLRTMPGSDPAQNLVVHSHPHTHGDYTHRHLHVHGLETHSHPGEPRPLPDLDRRFGKFGRYQLLRPLLVGIVHGLAGSAAVTLLILASIRRPTLAVAYLLVFGIGTIAGMMLITMSIASALRYVGRHFEGFSRRLGLASGVLSLAFGLFLSYQVGVVQGLFGAHPQWTPH